MSNSKKFKELKKLGYKFINEEANNYTEFDDYEVLELNNKDLIDYLTFKKDYGSLMDDKALFVKYLDDSNIIVTGEMLLKSLQNADKLEIPYETFFGIYQETLNDDGLFGGKLIFYDRDNADISDLFLDNESNLTALIYARILGSNEDNYLGDLLDNENIIKDYFNNRFKPINKRKYHEETLRFIFNNIHECLQDNTHLSDEIITFYQNNMEELLEWEFEDSIINYAEDLTTGNQAFKKDVNKAIEVLKELYDKDEDDDVALRIARIYETNPIFSRDLAFKWYSVAAACGNVEACIKLADWMLNGSCGLTSWKGAYSILSIAENYAFIEFEKGNGLSYYADVAYRLSALYYKGMGVEREEFKAVRYALRAKADYLNRLRCYSGDQDDKNLGIKIHENFMLLCPHQERLVYNEGYIVNDYFTIKDAEAGLVDDNTIELVIENGECGFAEFPSINLTEAAECRRFQFVEPITEGVDLKELCDILNHPDAVIEVHFNELIIHMDPTEYDPHDDVYYDDENEVRIEFKHVVYIPLYNYDVEMKHRVILCKDQDGNPYYFLCNKIRNIDDVITFKADDKKITLVVEDTYELYEDELPFDIESMINIDEK